MPDQPFEDDSLVNNDSSGESTGDSQRRQDDKAVEHLLEQYRPLLRALVANEIDATLRSKVDPSDLVQETCLEVVKAYPKVEFVKSKQFVTYVRQVIINKLHDVRRRFLISQKRNTRLERSLHLEHAADASEDGMAGLDRLIDEELCERTRLAVLKLPLEVQKVLHMRFHKAMSYKDIGQRIGRSEDDVRMLIKRCLLRIRQEVRPGSSS